MMSDAMIIAMSVAEETGTIVDLLPPDKAQSVLEFAMFPVEKYADAE